MKTVSWKDIPTQALALMGDDQLSYIDEFIFLMEDDGIPMVGYIEAHYAGELLAVWNGERWVIPAKRQHAFTI